MKSQFQFLIGIIGFLIVLTTVMAVISVISYLSPTDDAPRLPDVEFYRSITGELLDTRPPVGGLILRFFYSMDCPIANDQIGKLRHVTERFGPEKALIMALCVDPEITAEKLQSHADSVGLHVPLIWDRNHEIARTFDVTTVPDWILTDISGRVIFRGSMDNQYAGRSRRRPGEAPNLLVKAIENWFEGRPVDDNSEQENQIGCPIPLLPETQTPIPDYVHDVAPILKNNCTGCHSQGQSGPFSLTSYESAAKRAGDIVNVVNEGLMPPWKPEKGSTPPLSHERRLLESEKLILQLWALNGRLRTSADHSKPDTMTATNPSNHTSVPLNEDVPRQNSSHEPADTASDWPLGSPDLILTMPEPFIVPAGGPDIYRCFVLPTGLTEDVALSAIDVRPGNPKVVHHVFNYIDVREIGKKRDCQTEGPGYDCFSGFDGDQIFGAIGGWTPGNQTKHFGDGVGLRLPSKSDIVMQVHYHPIGTEQMDQTRVGLYFARNPIKKALQWISACENPAQFRLPAGAEEVTFNTSLKVPMDVHLHAMTPHMHLLGRSIRASIRFPNGSEMSLIQIRDWDFNQQDTYYLRDPLWIPKGSTIEIQSEFDNSSNNPFNPNQPPMEVQWGEASTDEMMILFLALTKASQDLTRTDEVDRFMEEFFEQAK
ncbi:MAG: hypothetical protein RJA81_2061 [Planctomycetota bacterium]